MQSLSRKLGLRLTLSKNALGTVMYAWTARASYQGLCDRTPTLSGWAFHDTAGFSCLAGTACAGWLGANGIGAAGTTSNAATGGAATGGATARTLLPDPNRSN